MSAACTMLCLRAHLQHIAHFAAAPARKLGEGVPHLVGSPPKQSLQRRSPPNSNIMYDNKQPMPMSFILPATCCLPATQWRACLTITLCTSINHRLLNNITTSGSRLP